MKVVEEIGKGTDSDDVSDESNESIRNGIMPHLWGINLSHIYAREVR